MIFYKQPVACKLLFQFIIVTCCYSFAYPQPDSLYVIQRVSGIVLDGLSDEEAWKNITPVPLTQYEPNFDKPSSERTEIRFGHDDDYFYASMRAYDSDPNGIRGNTLYRDRLSGSDHFELLIDTFNDNETGYIFSTLPTGIRHDAAITNDASGGGISVGGWIQRSFNTFWDVETVVNDDGWFAEMRIPFSSLRFQEQDGKVIMGLSAQRKIARRSERLVFPRVEPTADWAFLKPSRAQKILFRDVYSRKRVYVTPYGLTGISQEHELNPGGTAFEAKRELEGQIGGDLKYSLTNNLTLDLTVNTDFAQAEADDQQINLTRFSLFFPEKRQFFLERAGIFDFRTGGLSRLFHSRRIGLTDDGRPVRIYGGARIVGRLGGWDLGFLNLQTEKSAPLASENFGVVRARRRVFNEYSYAGGMLTSRIGVDGSYNLGYGVDGVIRLFSDDYLTVQWAQTFDNVENKSERMEGLNSGRLAAEITRRRRQGFGYDLGTIWSGKNYNPGVGFVQRKDFLFGTSTVSNTWMPSGTSPFIWHRLALEGFGYMRNSDQSIESAEIGPEWSFSSRTTSSGSVETRVVYENLLSRFELSDPASPDSVYVPAGSYTFYRVGLLYSMPFERLVRTSVRLQGGPFYDGWQVGALLTPTWYISKHLELSAEYQFDYIRFDERSQRLTSHIARLRIGTAVNKNMSINAFVQYNSTISAVSANIRFRYNFREGNDLWVVYNEGINTNRNRFRPRLPFSDVRTFLVKYTYTVQF